MSRHGVVDICLQASKLFDQQTRLPLDQQRCHPPRSLSTRCLVLTGVCLCRPSMICLEGSSCGSPNASLVTSETANRLNPAQTGWSVLTGETGQTVQTVQTRHYPLDLPDRLDMAGTTGPAGSAGRAVPAGLIF